MKRLASIIAMGIFASIAASETNNFVLPAPLSVLTNAPPVHSEKTVTVLLNGISSRLQQVVDLEKMQAMLDSNTYAARGRIQSVYTNRLDYKKLETSLKQLTREIDDHVARMQTEVKTLVEYIPTDRKNQPSVPSDTPVPQIIVTSCATVSTSPSDEQMMANCMLEARADVSSALETMKELQSRTIEDAVKDGGGIMPPKLLREHAALIDELALLSTQMHINRKTYTREAMEDDESWERKEAFIKIQTARCQLALEKFFRQKTKGQTNQPSRTIDATPQ